MDLSLIADLHVNNPRQGPGGDDETRLAIQLAGLDSDAPLKISDIGCGTGAASLVLANTLSADIIAVDFLPEFLSKFAQTIENYGLSQQIKTLEADMNTLPFADKALDVIWSEGAIYNMGFENGINAWKRFLKPGGILAVSEITWFTDTRPQELTDYWHSAYPQIATASEKIAQLEKAGYKLKGYFPLPEYCWTQNYYEPLALGFEKFLSRHPKNTEANELVAADKQEIALYQQFKAYFGYGFYIASLNA